MPIQVFSDRGPEFSIRIDQPHVIRSITFNKVSAASQLRVTYRDKAKTAASSDFFTASVEVKIDAVPMTLLATIFDAVNSPSGGFNFFSVTSPFTTIGYIKNISAGQHTLSSSYTVAGTNNVPIIGFITNNPFLIEIDETP